MIKVYPHEVAELLEDKGQTVAVAESCTGGMLGQELTAIPGSSAWFLGGIISYSNQVKTDFLGVPADLIIEQGAVSREVAEIMAHSVRNRFEADYGLSITGIAGPGGGSEEKPVGLVYVACADMYRCNVMKYIFRGSRNEVRSRATRAVLSLLKDALTGNSTPIRLEVID